jgi:DNA-binding NarL/FixJ family response regulator
MLDREVSLLQSSFEVVGIVHDGRALVSEARRLHPDVIVLDISMPIMTGIEAAHELHKSGSTAKLVFLTVHQEAAFVHKCFPEGGIAYVIKSRMVTDLIPAIQEALSDHSFVSPSVVH